MSGRAPMNARLRAAHARHTRYGPARRDLQPLSAMAREELRKAPQERRSRFPSLLQLLGLKAAQGQQGKRQGKSRRSQARRAAAARAASTGGHAHG